MISYPVRLVPTGRDTVRVIFPDVPQATTEGRDEDDALYRAKFVLEMCLTHMAVHGQRPPRPSDICAAPTVTTDKFSIPETEQA